jgi:hypothetical protein
MLGSMKLWAENTANVWAENPQAYLSHSTVNRALGVSKKAHPPTSLGFMGILGILV